MTRRPPLPQRRDLLVSVAVAAVAQLELTLARDSVSGSPLWHHLAYLLLLPGFALRRVLPLASIACAAVALALEPLLGTAAVATPYLSLLVLLVSLGWHASLRTGITGVALTLGAGLTYDLTRDRLVVADLVVNVVIIVVAWGAGHLLRSATDRRIRSEVAAERAAQQAIETERARIAGDLHDSLAHALTLITLQAGGARERTDQPVAVQALSAIEETGRDALEEMQRFLSLLDGPSSPAAPGIGDLPRLVQRVREGGLAVHLDAQPVEVTPGVSTTVYRVVQEALTNVVRHSDAANANVVVHRQGPLLVIRVSDDGRSVTGPTPGSGRGLAGLVERVTAFDGTVSSGRTSGGWHVEARIPLTGGAT